MAAFEAYSDESGVPNQRYKAIAVVSGSRADLASLRGSLQSSLTQPGIRELKFAEVKGDRRRWACADEFVAHAVEFAGTGRIRLDVIVWDMQDSRHAIRGRDDIACLERMYYHVLINMARRWGREAWRFFPDEQSAVDFWEMQNYLNMTTARRGRRGQPALLKRLQQERRAFRFNVLVCLQRL